MVEFLRAQQQSQKIKEPALKNVGLSDEYDKAILSSDVPMLQYLKRQKRRPDARLMDILLEKIRQSSTQKNTCSSRS